MKRLIPCILFLFAFLFIAPSAKASTFFFQQNAGVAFVPQVAFVPTNAFLFAGGGCNSFGAFGSNTFFVSGRRNFVGVGGGSTTFIQSGGLLGRRNTFFQQNGGGKSTTLIQGRSGPLGLRRSTFFNQQNGLGGSTTFFGR